MFTHTMPETEEYKIVRITNRTDFDFTPEMGARFGGVPYLIPAGKSMLVPKPVGKLLAKHLARQVFIKNAPIRDEKETDGRGRDRALWTEEQVVETANRFISEEYEQEKPVALDEAAIMAKKIAALNSDFPIGGGSMNAASTDAPVSGYQDKAQVIAELEKRGIAHDKRQGKDKLEALLK